MHVIVVGCGRVGSGLAGTLEEQGNTVSVIDRRSQAFRRLPEAFRGRRIEGVGFDRGCLEEAGITYADGLAAVTSGDNSNILIARVAAEAFGVPRVVARIYDARRAAIYERLGIPTVATVEWSTAQVLHRLLPDRAEPVWADPTDAVVLVERPLSTRWSGRPVGELERAGEARVTALTRDGVTRLPSTDETIAEGDIALLAADRAAVAALDRRLAAGPPSGGG